MERWLNQLNVVTPTPGQAHLHTVFRLIRQVGAAASLTANVQIAAHAIDMNGEVSSNDGDFGRDRLSAAPDSRPRARRP